MNNQLCLNNYCLEFLIDQIPQPAYVKNITTRKYTMVNQSFLHMTSCGDIDELNIFLQNNKGNSKCLCNLETKGGKYFTRVPRALNDYLIEDRSEKIYFYTIVQLPLMDKNENFTSVFTIHFPSMANRSLFSWYEIYKEHSKTKKEAIAKFLRHFDLLKLFSKLPSEKELLCLLHMRVDASHRTLAKKLNISKKTVESHIASLTNRIYKKNISLVLAQLRSLLP